MVYIYIFLSIRSNKYGSDKKAIASSMTSSCVTLLKFVFEHDLNGWWASEWTSVCYPHSCNVEAVCILTLVFSKMVKLTKYAKILICRDRSNGSSIKELVDSYGHGRETILIILHTGQPRSGTDACPRRSRSHETVVDKIQTDSGLWCFSKLTKANKCYREYRKCR